jgi:hypothetical protein
MTYIPKPGDGSLFKNDHKTEDKHPNATGYIIAHRDISAGEKLNLAAWTKDGKGGKFQSLRMSDIRTTEATAETTEAPPPPPSPEEEIPF